MTDMEIKDNEARASELLDREWLMLVGGELVDGISGRTFETRNPATGALLGFVPFAEADDVERAVVVADEAFKSWRRTSVMDRVRYVNEMITVLRENTSDLGLLDAIDNGSPVTAMTRDVQLACEVMGYYTSTATEVKGVTVPATAQHLHLTLREPFGVVGRIVPYNHPLLFVATKIVPPVLMGNTVIMKGPEQAPISSLYLAQLIKDIFPPGVVNILAGDGPITGDAIVRHPKVKRIAFTGSVETGMRVQRSAAEASVKKVSLELGGKNALIVLPDADLDAAVPGAVLGMNFHWSQSQSCGSTSRLFLHEDIHDVFLARLKEEVEKLHLGNPIDPRTEMGCIVSAAQYDKVISFIEDSKAQGAVLVTGGGKPSGECFEKGLFIAPTVFAEVRDDMRIAVEEIFGPVLSVFKWRDEEEVLRRANDVSYGLTGSIWTKNLDAAIRFARELETGFVWVNGSSYHFPGVPFGGHKNSGTDYEDSIDELYSFTEIKSINFMTT